MRQLFVLILLFATPFMALGEKLHFVTEELPPLQVVNASHEVGGATVEIVQEVIRRANLDAYISVYPWARAYKAAMNENNTLIFSLRRSELREPYFQWLGKLYPIRTYFSSLKTEKDVEINTPEDLRKYRVGVVRSDFIQQQITSWGMQDAVYIAADHKKLWMLLFHNKIDVVVSNGFSLAEEFKSLGWPVDKVKFNQSPLFLDEDLYLAANINLDKNTARKISDALQRVKDDGTYDKILGKYHLLLK